MCWSSLPYLAHFSYPHTALLKRSLYFKTRASECLRLDIPLPLYSVCHAQQHVRDTDKIERCNNAIALILDMLSCWASRKKAFDRQGVAEKAL